MDLVADMILEVGNNYRLADGTTGVCHDVGWAYKIGVWYYDCYGESEGSAPDVIGLVDDTPKTWGDMTPEEKGALLLAAHEGKVIDICYPDEGRWVAGDPHGFHWNQCLAYRVRHEPKRDTVTLYGGGKREMVWCMEKRGTDLDTHRITFDLIDGEPDCASIKMERIK